MESDLPIEPNENEFVNFPAEIQDFRMFTSGAPGNEKLSIVIQKGYHLTFHFGQKSKIFDIHLTREGRKKHVTLFKMHHFAFARAAAIMNPFFKFGVLKYLKSNRINLGKLVRHNCILKKLTDNDSYEKMFKTTQKGKHSQSMKFLERINIGTLRGFYIEPDDVFDTTCDFFEIYKYKKNALRKTGYLLKQKSGEENYQFYYISKRNWTLYNALLEWGAISAIKHVNLERKKAILRTLVTAANKKYKGTSVYRQLNADTRPNAKSTNSFRKNG